MRRSISSLGFTLVLISMAQAKLGAEETILPQEKKEKQRRLIEIKSYGSNPTSRYPLGRCEGDCDSDSQCTGGLVCFQRGSNVRVPGCNGGQSDGSRTDYCVDPNDLSSAPRPSNPPPAPAPVVPNPPGGDSPPLKSYGSNPPAHLFPLGECEGDCDSDNDCDTGLKCFQRNSFDPVPGCSGNDSSRTDYCIRSGSNNGPAPAPSNLPPTSVAVSNFRLKLYWQEGYYWQEETFERKWCMKCRNAGCNHGNKIYISECGANSQRFDFVPVDNDEILIRLHGKNLCFERVNKDIYMHPCDAGNTRQQWYAKNGDFGGNRFEISQYGFSDYCITQRHHPKDDEEVELEACSQARDGQTSYWNRY